MKKLIIISLFFLTSLSTGAKETYPIYCSDGICCTQAATGGIICWRQI